MRKHCHVPPLARRRAWFREFFTLSSSLWLIASGGPPAIVHAQDAQAAATKTDDARAGAVTSEDGSRARQWRAVKRRAHETEWQSVRHITNRITGEVRAVTNSVIELADGLNKFDATTRSWRAASPAFRVTDQGAVAEGARHQVVLAPNIRQAGAVTVRKGNLKFSAHPLCVAYYDPLDGSSYVLGVITDAPGWLTSSNSATVVYSNCFQGLKASIRYRNTLVGLEQDLLLAERPPVTPEELGLSPRTRLELFSEIVGDTPLPQLTTQVIDREPDPILRAALFESDFTDQTLGFGELKMGRGKAFLHTSTRDPRQVDDAFDAPREVPVSKRFEIIDGRRLIIEAVDHRRIAPHLNRLPASTVRGVTNAALWPRHARDGLLAAFSTPMDLPTMPSGPGIEVSGRMQVAANGPPTAPNQSGAPSERVEAARGTDLALVIDWQLLEAGPTLQDYTFYATNSYSIVGNVNLGGQTRFMGGTVLKYAPYASGAALNIHGSVVCDAGDLTPIILGSSLFSVESPATLGPVQAAGSRANIPPGTPEISQPTPTGLCLNPIPHIPLIPISNSWLRKRVLSSSWNVVLR